MRIRSITLATLVLALVGGIASAQTPAPAPVTAPTPVTAPVPAPDTPASPPGEVWGEVTRNDTRIYLADVSSITVTGDVTAIHLARIPLHPRRPGDRSYILVEMEFHCAAKESRELAETDHDDTGAILDRTESGEDFAGYRPETLDAYLAAVACDGARAVTTYPSIDAVMATTQPAA